MSRRVPKLAAALLALVISLSAPSAFAASRDRGAGPDPGSRIVQIIKSFIRHFTPGSNVEWPSLPKP
jgi:hypothetical protein